MKKILILTITLFTLLSCSKSSDDINDPIIGKWQHSEGYTNGINNNLSYCSKKTTIEFKSNNELTIIGFSSGNVNCSSVTDNGTWQNTSNSNYDITLIDSQGKTFYETTDTIVFSNNNNTFTVANSETLNGVTTTYTSVYIKI